MDLSIISLLIAPVYLAILAGIFYLISTWVNKFIVLKQEQNDLLREIIKKMDNKANWKEVYLNMPNYKKNISKTALIFLVLLTFSIHIAAGQSVYVGKAGAHGEVLKRYIEPSELKQIVENPVDSIWIIDVRSEKAYSNGHIPTAKSFPVGTVESRLKEIPKSQYLILYCTVGANAQIVSKKLKKAGYKRYINWGGISRWEWDKEPK